MQIVDFATTAHICVAVVRKLIVHISASSCEAQPISFRFYAHALRENYLRTYRQHILVKPGAILRSRVEAVKQILEYFNYLLGFALVPIYILHKAFDALLISILIYRQFALRLTVGEEDEPFECNSCLWKVFNLTILPSGYLGEILICDIFQLFFASIT